MMELRPGLKVRYRSAAADGWLEGELVRSSPNGEEWLVKNRFGRFWIHVSRLRPPEDDAQPDHDR
jgi:hypothetical protein